MLLVVIIMFYGDFPLISLFCYNSAGQENPVLRIFKFQGPSRTQIDLGFLVRETPEEEEVNETRPRDRTSTGGAATRPGCATQTRWGLEPPLSSIFISYCSA
jgi:hypothetical protein